MTHSTSATPAHDWLALLGRHGTSAVAFSVFAGVALPPLAAWCRPLFVPSLFLLMCLAFLRVDPREVRARIVRPGLVALAALWIMLVVPALVGAALMVTGTDTLAPGLSVALILQTTAPPLISSAALAAMIGLDSALALVTLIVCTAGAPLTATLFAVLLVGPSVPISAGALGLKLTAMLAGAAIIAALTRRIAGREFVERQAQPIDGINVILLFVFVVAVMHGVAANAIAQPKLVLGLTALAFAISFGLTGITTLIFMRAGLPATLALGVGAGSRNMGLMFAAAAGAMPDVAWLYFGLSQFPIYLMPLLVRQVVRRFTRA